MRQHSLLYFVFSLLFVALLVPREAFGLNCKTSEDCGVCQECGEHGVCTNVAPMTDPRGDCSIMCGVQLVCGAEPHCVLNNRPTCECDWSSGLCVENDSPDIPLDDAELTITLEEGEEEIDETTVIDVVIDEKEDTEEDDYYQNTKNTWGLHSVGVAMLMVGALTIMLGVVFLFVKLIVMMNKPETAFGFDFSSDASESDEENPSKKQFQVLPTPIREARRQRKSRKKQQRYTEMHKMGDSAFMTEVPIGPDGYISASLHSN